MQLWAGDRHGPVARPCVGRTALADLPRRVGRGGREGGSALLDAPTAGATFTLHGVGPPAPARVGPSPRDP